MSDTLGGGDLKTESVVGFITWGGGGIGERAGVSCTAVTESVLLVKF